MRRHTTSTPRITVQSGEALPETGIYTCLGHVDPIEEAKCRADEPDTYEIEATGWGPAPPHSTCYHAVYWKLCSQGNL